MCQIAGKWKQLIAYGHVFGSQDRSFNVLSVACVHSDSSTEADSQMCYLISCRTIRLTRRSCRDGDREGQGESESTDIGQEKDVSTYAHQIASHDSILTVSCATNS